MTTKKRMNKKYPLIIIALAVLLVGVSTALMLKTSLAPAPQPLPQNNTNVNVGNPNPANAPEPTAGGHDITNTRTIKLLPTPVTSDAAQISSRLGLKIAALSETAPRNPEKSYGNNSYSLSFLELGTVEDFDLYVISQDCVNVSSESDDMLAPPTYVPDGCVPFNILAKYDPSKKKFLVYSKHSSGVGMTYRDVPNNLPIPLNKVTAKTDEIISDLAVPAKATLLDGYTLSPLVPGMLVNGPLADINADMSIAYKPVGISLEGYNVYQTSHDSDTYYLKDGDFGYAPYSLNIPFYTNGRIPNIVWNDGTENDTDYSPFSWRSGSGPFDGFGAMNTLSEKDAANFSERFVVAGEAYNGEYVYIPKSDTDPLIERYTNVLPGSEPKKSAGPDIFLTRSPFNRALIWTKTELLPMAERGKPVVYLYPTETEQISVKYGESVKVLKSEPDYANGWTVTARPSGSLITSDGKTYPYLYWDGDSDAYAAPKQGWVVASSNVDSFLSSKLAELGLNVKESADFREFWTPIVSRSPFARISFVPQEKWSAAAPLAISPAPDTVIRVFMDWQPLSAPISIEPQALPPTPVRTGFTAVEWGGLLYK
jgi:hypothetical protein